MSEELIDPENLTPEQMQELKTTGYVFINGERYKPVIDLEIKVINPDGSIAAIL